MFLLLLTRLVFEALALLLILKLVARHEADTQFSTLMGVVAAILFGGPLAVLLLKMAYPATPAWVSAAVEVLLGSILIMWFCWTSFWKSLLVVLLFGLLHLALLWGVQWMCPGMDLSNPFDFLIWVKRPPVRPPA